VPALNPDVPSEVHDSARLRRGPTRQRVFVIAAIAMFMSTLDLTIVAVALPAIHHNLHATINWAGWTITIYGVGIVVALPVAGKFSHQFGRRRVFLYGVAIFTIASLLCGLATDIYMLIIFRGVQAIGGGALQPSAAGLVVDHFGRDRDRALGMFGTIAAGGQVLGPVLGGILVGFLSWRWIFFVNVPVGVALFSMIAIYIPESKLSAPSRTDVKGLALLVTFILATIFGITELGEGHTAVYSPTFLVPEFVAVVLFVVFLRHSKREKEPFIPARLLHAKGFAVINAEGFFWGAFGFGVASLVPLYAEERYHLSALSAGTLLSVRAVGMMAVGAIAAFSLRRTGYRLPMIVGFSVVGVGTLFMASSPLWGASPYIWLGLCAGVTGLGNGVANPASRNACLELDPEASSVVVGIRSMFNYLGVIFSVSIVTAILNRSPNPGLAQAHIYWVAAGFILLVMVPLVLRVPEHKGTW
jgi:EmrB/QacA subfamily drug resistance transporter